MGAYIIAIDAPETIRRVRLDNGKEVKVVSYSFCYKPYWSDDEENARMRREYFKPRRQRWQTIVRPKYFVWKSEGEAASAGDDVYRVTGWSFNDEAFNFEKNKVGYIASEYCEYCGTEMPNGIHPAGPCSI